MTLLLLPLLLPALLLVGRLRRKLWARLGFHSRRAHIIFQEMPRPRVWIHAASVGEVLAILPMARIFKERNPNIGLVISTATVTGLQQAKEKMPFASAVIMLPLDFRSCVRRVLKMVEPNLLVMAETELWPNLIREAKRQGSQLALVNGRLTARSLKRYGWIRGLVRQLLVNFDLMAVQSAEDLERFLKLGANPQRLKILNNIKFDISLPRDLGALRSELRLPHHGRIWVAGSTRPGEEEIILEAYRLVLKEAPQTILILAPRHLDRLRDLERLLMQQRMAFALRSQVAQELLNFPVILVDTMGELADIYGLGRVAFVGGSLIAFGGHNPLEPASRGVPILMGPHTDHFAQVVQILKERGALRVVTQAQDLAQAVIACLLNPEAAQQQGQAGLEVVKTYQGTAMQTAELLQKLMLIKQWAGEVRRWREESQVKRAYTQSKETDPDDWPM